MIPPFTIDEFKMHAKSKKYVAVFQEMPAGTLTPACIYSILNKEYDDQGVLLENLYQHEASRFSYICFDILATFSVNSEFDSQPLAALRELQSQFDFATRADVADLISSAAGFVTYDAVRFFESIPDRHDKNELPTMLFHFYALSLTFNHEKNTILISHLVKVNDDLDSSYQMAQQKISVIIKLLTTLSTEESITIKQKVNANVCVEPSDADFMDMVVKAKEYITRGDAFQIVLSRTFKREISASPFDIYKTLREVSPAPFMFYFPIESGAIIGASPERFIRIHQHKITLNPIAGTRKRKVDGDKTDAMIEEDLLSDTKECAEHMMLVDLARNDMGAVSKPGSVTVNELLKVKHYSHVSHIASIVTGQLNETYDALDAFSSAFPAGTLSGAPKIRAMQIIDELETSRRGLYGGAICRLSSSGNLDSAIAIRMAHVEDNKATVRTGAGIVYDSNPFNEMQETYQKAQSLLDTLAVVHGE